MKTNTSMRMWTKKNPLHQTRKANQMKVVSTKNNIVFLKADTQYELTSTFLRVAEFYESPSLKFRNKYFELEDYMDWYAKENGNFTYMSDWTGYNVPGNVIANFLLKFHKKLTKKETNLHKLITKSDVDASNKFYVIATCEDDNTIDHEYAHAMYYLDKDYANRMNGLVALLPKKFRIAFETKLIEDGYCKQVLIDETQAYLATNTMLQTDKMVNLEVPWNMVLVIQKTFDEFYKKYKKEAE